MQKFVYITIGLGAGLSLFLLGPIFSNSLLEAVKTLALIAVLFLLLYFAVYIFNQSRIEELKRITHGASISEIVETPSKAIPLAFVYGTGIKGARLKLIHLPEQVKQAARKISAYGNRIHIIPVWSSKS